MSEEQTTSLADIQRDCNIEEDMGYDVPFVTFTWMRWQDMHAHILHAFPRFQRAIDHGQLQLAALIVLEIQEIAAEMHKEICASISMRKLTDQ